MTTPSTLRTLGFTLLLLLAGLVSEVMGIVVAPTAVYLTDTRPAGVVTLFNPSTIPEEVSVETLFGYPVTDDQGNIGLFTDPDSEDPRSAAEWIRALPQRLVVPPGQRRSVRLLARPPADLPPGEYWTRLVFTSRGQQLPVEGAPESEDISVGLNLEIRTVTAAAYRNGPVSTGVVVEGFAPEVVGDSLVVRPDFVRQGNAAFIGRMQAQLVNDAGEVAASWDRQVAVYREHHRRYAWDVSDLPAGTYRFQIRLSTDRQDIAARDRLRAAPVVETAEVTILE